MRCVLTPARIECLPWFQEIWSPVRKLCWRLWVAEKKFPPACQAPQFDPGNVKAPRTGTKESSRLLAAAADKGQGAPLLMAGIRSRGVMPSPAHDWTVTPSVTFRNNLWAEPHTSFTKLLVTTDV